MIDYYTPEVDARLAVTSPLTMLASFAISGGDASVNAQISVDQVFTGGDVFVYFVVTEDDVHGHDNIARLVLDPEPFTLTTPGESVSINRVFTLDPAWKESDIEIVVFVQPTSGNLAVLQAAKAVANYVGTITVATEPAGLGAAWTLTGPNGYHVEGVDGRHLAVFDVGEYSLTFDPVEEWTSPSPATVGGTMVEDGALVFTGVYTDGPFTGLIAGDLGHAGAGSGASMVDYDGDGDLDIHVVNAGEADLLLRNDAGAFTNVAVGAAADAGEGRAAAWADYDNDGDLDYYLSRYDQENRLVRNEGGTFVDANFGSIGDAGPGTAVAWADHDLDGQVDLYLCNDGANNTLYQNYGSLGDDWLFLAQGGVMNDGGNTYGAAWADFDDDGDPDLFFTTHSGADVLYRNDLEYGFWEVDAGGILADTGMGTACEWGDYDNDGDFDLFAAVDGGGDRLVVNLGESNFSLQLGTPMSDSAPTRAAAWGDYDNDGDLDLYQGKDGLYDRLLRNDGGGAFTEIGLGVPETAGAARSVAWGDVDGDGDLDLYVVNESGGNVLLRNDLDNGNHWLHLRLAGTESNVSAIGARVELVAGGLTQVREVASGSGGFATHSLDVEFGLGDATVIDTLTIRWPSDTVQTFTGLSVDTLVEIAEDATTGIEHSDDAGDEDQPRVFALLRARPNPFNPSTTFGFALPEPSHVRVGVFDVSGRLVKVLLDEPRSRGVHELTWDGLDAAGRAVSAGLYLLEVRAGFDVATQRVMLVK